MLFLNLYGSNNNICHCSIFITIIDKSKERCKEGKEGVVFELNSTLDWLGY